MVSIDVKRADNIRKAALIHRVTASRMLCLNKQLLTFANGYYIGAAVTACGCKYNLVSLSRVQGCN
jgi:hypothetical protein